MQKLFLVNKTLANLLFNKGYPTIPPGGYAAIPAEDASGEEVRAAVQRGWAEVTELEPASISIPAVEARTYEPIDTGMTADQIVAERAEQAQEPKADKGEVTVAKLGTPTEEAPAQEEVTVHKLGTKAEEEGQVEAQVETSEAEVVSEEAKPAGRGRKAK